MLDGGDIQTLWEYGPKGYYYNLKDDGSFEFLGKKSNPKTKYANGSKKPAGAKQQAEIGRASCRERV